MGFIGRQLLKVIEWTDSTPDTMAYKYPMTDRDEIMNGCQLIVRESQTAILVSSGRLADIFAPGRYKLSTGNIPILSKLAGWKYGFDSPYKCDVYYINTKQFINQKWGTANPVMMRDQDFGMVQFRGYGQFTFRVNSAETFLKELLGTGASYKVKDIVDQLKRTIVSGITEAVAASNVPALDLAMKYTAIGDIAYNIIKPKFVNMGIELASLDIENLSLTDESMAALSKRTNMNIIGNANEYTQYAAADSMKTMADNAHKGNGANFSGMFMNMGLGQAMAGNMNNAMNNANSAAAPAPAAAANPCPKCGVNNKQDAKFCHECGEKMGLIKCLVCGATHKASAKFCPECGGKVGAGPTCPKCKNVCKPGAKFCPECGERI